MNDTIQIPIDAPHDAQQQILELAERFNIVMCGRRFGKTVLIRKLCLSIIEGKRVGLFAPAFKDVSETWESLEQIAVKINAVYKGYISIDNSARTMHIIRDGQTVDNAACIEFWSLANERKKNDGRGRKYHTVIYEETQKIDTNVLEYHWRKVARPTLTDFKGDAWFFMTPPNSRKHFAYKLLCIGALNTDLHKDSDIIILPDTLKSKNYISFRMPTSANPYIDLSELEQIKSELPETIYKQEYEAICVEYAENPFCFVLQDLKTQQRVFQKSMPFFNDAETVFSFDFNKNPMAAIAVQHGTNSSYINVVKEFGAPEQQQVNIQYTCDQIKKWVFLKWGVKIGKWGANKYNCPRHVKIKITGDATGNTSDPRQAQGMTFYQIILDELGLSIRELQLFSSNPPHSESFLHLNTYLDKHPKFYIDEIQCPNLRVDMLNAQANEDRGINKKAYDPHYLDTLRYFLEAFTPRKLKV